MTSFQVPWDLLMDITVVLLLFGAGFHVSEGRKVLIEEGCTVYWNEYQGGFEGELVNKTELEWFKEYGTTTPPVQETGNFPVLNSS